MNLKKCCRCQKRPAVIYMSKTENGTTTSDGYCLQCARELGFKQVDDILEKMGITPEEFDAMSETVGDMISAENDDDTTGRAPSLDLNAIFNNDKPVEAPGAPKRTADTQPQDGKKSAKDRKFLTQFCIDLTGRAKEGKLDAVIGRDRELERVIQILCRRQKNNPCLIGEPGVGKTAIAEALAQKISAGDVPYKLHDKEVFLVDMTAIVAGTQFRGQFESRMKGLIDETKKNGNIILVIDEIHSIVGAGNAEGGMNAANILKPALSRGEIQLIGATTLSEYRQYIEHDAALERRFQPIIVNEPSVEDSIRILSGIKKYYEQHHGIKIPDHIVRRIVTLSERYITDRFLPDKAIDLMDEACAHIAMNSTVVNEIEALAADIAALSARKSALEAKEPHEESDYAEIANLTTELLGKNERFDALKAERDRLELTDSDLAEVIETWTGIPASDISQNDYQKIINLEDALKSRIVGQDDAITEIAKAIRRSRAGISYKKKPVSFIFAGSTGVGKTELVKVLSRYLFDSPESMIRLDMSEFMEKHSVSKIIGSPPGYVGYDDAGQLTEKIRRKPYSIVLFDEIEKAHPDVMNILLQILDDGRITDSHGKEVNFENTVIIMTTNAGSTDTSSSAGFAQSQQSSDRDRTMRSLESFLRPEFINRVDKIIVFNRLSSENIKAICNIMLGDLEGVLSEKGIKFSWDESTVDYLAKKGYSDKYGARNLRRLIQTDIEDQLASVIITNYQSPIIAASVTAENGEIKITCI